jgi:hypothetical protein
MNTMEQQNANALRMNHTSNMNRHYVVGSFVKRSKEAQLVYDDFAEKMSVLAYSLRNIADEAVLKAELNRFEGFMTEFKKKTAKGEASGSNAVVPVQAVQAVPAAVQAVPTRRPTRVISYFDEEEEG